MTIPNQDPIFQKVPTALPFAGTTGHSGSDTSKDRAESEAASGAAAARQHSILGLLEQAGPIGLTWKEIDIKMGRVPGHGSISGSLSSMHKEGLVSALKMDRRNGSGVYVLPKFVVGRITRPYNENKTRSDARPIGSVPPARPRPRLTPEEVSNFAKVRTSLSQLSDQVFVRMQRRDVLAMLNALDRLHRG